MALRAVARALAGRAGLKGTGGCSGKPAGQHYPCSLGQPVRRWSTAAPSAEAAPSGPSPWGMLLVVPPVITVGLGVWQISRHGEKKDELAGREAALTQAPVELTLGMEHLEEYTRVHCKGVFDHSRAIYLGPRVKSSMGSTIKGWTLLTPLVPKPPGGGWFSKGGAPDAPEVLVMRGWVPDEWRGSEEMRKAGEPSGEVEVVGVTRHGERAGVHTPTNEPDTGVFYWLDEGAAVAACGLSPGSPMVEVLEDRLVVATEDQVHHPGGLSKQTRAKLKIYQGELPKEFPAPREWKDIRKYHVMPEDHLNYAATWFSIAGLTAYMAYLALRKPRANKRIRPPGGFTSTPAPSPVAGGAGGAGDTSVAAGK